MEIIKSRAQRLDELDRGFQKTAIYMLERYDSDISLLDAKLVSASPKGIMSRGYAYVSSQKTKETIKSFAQTAVGDILDIRLFKGSLQAGVTKVKGEK